ncbi:MAG: site-specific DNA-methyltransferase [Epsilonproteobacteria bacterium]|nr:site-specific DNA-methyltransferase [Campylobacterota bacterium]
MSKYESYTKEQLIEKIKQFESKKNYGLVWDDEKEPENVVLECQNNIPILKKNDDKTVQTDKNKPNNILIEGDNYHALQVLNYTHKGQIDVIYIDPPYNTGNQDFKYNDSFVDKEDGYRHSKWLNFMSKRLKLAHNLLKDSGVIFISIDDNEMAQLKLLCDKLFKGENFIENFVWNSRLGKGSTSVNTAKIHEYILCYSKQLSKIHLKGDTRQTVKEKRESMRQWGQGDSRKDRPTMFYEVFSEEYGLVYPIKPDGTEGRWRVGKNKFNELLQSGLIQFDKKDDDRIEAYKIIPSGYETSTAYSSILISDIVKTTAYGSSEIINIFGEKIFNYPKPTTLIKEFIDLATFGKKNSIILDFFAGSGTTGHAVLALNQEDGGNRQFILCTNNENDICTEVTYPRLDKVINGYTTPKGVDVSGLGGNLDYYRTDLVPTDGIANISDTTREELTKKAGNMIAIKENTHAMIELNEHYQIFQNETTSKQTAIYFTEDLSHFDELIEKTKGHKTKLYIFSFGKIDKSSYKYLGKNFEIEDIPEPIIEIYKEINKESVL